MEKSILNKFSKERREQVIMAEAKLREFDERIAEINLQLFNLDSNSIQDLAI